jgi:GMP synthase (glutamine-hydrolysing)
MRRESVTTLAAIRHVHFEDLSAFGPVFEAAGYAVEYWDVWERDLAAMDPLAPDILVVLGGPIGASDERGYPWVRHELAIIEARLGADKPVLGICLGAQMIARAAGARVYPVATEIGFGPITLSEAGRHSCLAPFGEEPLSLHWHGDSFDLPEGADHLASTQATPNQAFALGPKVLGVQFHPEFGLGPIEPWLIGHAVELNKAGIDPARLRGEAQAHAPALIAKARLVAEAWLAQL